MKTARKGPPMSRGLRLRGVVTIGQESPAHRLRLSRRKLGGPRPVLGGRWHGLHPHDVASASAADLLPGKVKRLGRIVGTVGQARHVLSLARSRRMHPITWPRGPGAGRWAVDKFTGVFNNSGRPPTPPVGWVRPRARRSSSGPSPSSLRSRGTLPENHPVGQPVFGWAFGFLRI